jgi:hypothetical protein
MCVFFIETTLQGAGVRKQLASETILFMHDAPEQLKRYALNDQIRDLPELLQLVLLGAVGEIGT